MATQQLLKIVYALDIKFWVRWCTCSMWRMLLPCWASKASPTLGCSIEISGDILSVCRLSYVVCHMSVFFVFLICFWIKTLIILQVRYML